MPPMELQFCAAVERFGNVRSGSVASIPQRTRGVRSTPMNGHCHTGRVGPVGAMNGNVDLFTSTTNLDNLTAVGGVISDAHRSDP